MKVGGSLGSGRALSGGLGQEDDQKVWISDSEEGLQLLWIPIKNIEHSEAIIIILVVNLCAFLQLSPLQNINHPQRQLQKPFTLAACLRGPSPGLNAPMKFLIESICTVLIHHLDQHLLSSVAPGQFNSGLNHALTPYQISINRENSLTLFIYELDQLITETSPVLSEFRICIQS